MSIAVDVDSVSNNNQEKNIHERLKKVAEDGDIERLYNLIAEDPNILGHFDQVPFCETPLHVAAEKGQTHFAMELMTLKPSLALKLNTSGFSPLHVALQNNHIQTVRGLIAIDGSLVSIKGKGRITPLHHVARSGDAELLSEFLFAYPSSVEDLTIKCETAIHIAVKEKQLEAFKVLWGWVKRVNREEILDWKDDDGNTVFHIAALKNQPEVMKLLRKCVKVKAKNREGKTAIDILQTHQPPPRFPKASKLLRSAKERLLSGSTMTLAAYLSRGTSLIEEQKKLLGLNPLVRSRPGSSDSNDSRSAILVVAVLIATATYQAGLSPPGGYEGGMMTMTYNSALIFYVFNGIAFFSSVYVIMILIIGLPMWIVLYGSTAAIGIANYASYSDTLPYQNNPFGDVAAYVLPIAYPVITGLILIPPFVAFLVNKCRRQRVDFPARYFSRSRDLSS